MVVFSAFGVAQEAHRPLLSVSGGQWLFLPSFVLLLTVFMTALVWLPLCLKWSPLPLSSSPTQTPVSLIHVPLRPLLFPSDNEMLVGAALWAADIEAMNTSMTDENAPTLQEGKDEL